jgi:hypothetical protein
MNRSILILACLSLGGCASVPGASGSADMAAKVLGNLEHCERQYIASVGGLGVPGGSLSIRCPAKPYADAAPVE